MGLKSVQENSIFSLEQLVQEIIGVNQAWKLACELEVGGNLIQIAKSLGELKTRLQVRLLRNYAPERVFLQLDTNNQGIEGEELYGLIFRKPVNHYWNAAHIPVRVANSVLSVDEIKNFLKFK